ncbi:MAG: DUF1998 domain-containing protein [Candidatus Thiosymbion ectosymbiont of Robbea hypermnestra]|nr:DUF1998 domain-containing protein [Candidatus Thiosymbion ectosymbiont of Robbea hypermnestra]
MSTWLPLLAVVVAVGLLGLIADRMVARKTHDRGTYWTRILSVTLAILVPAALLSWLFQEFDLRFWRLGIHMMPDLRTPGDMWRYWFALVLPVAIWALALLIVGFTDIENPTKGRWLAGALGMWNSRLWLIPVLAVPPAVLSLFAIDRLPATSTGGYPAALWSLTILVVANLVLIALSRGTPPQAQAQAQAPPAVSGSETSPPLPSWPQALREQGLEVQSLAVFEGDAGPVPESGSRPLRNDLTERKISHQVLDALLEGEGNRLLMAPDDCGQIEGIALLAERRITSANAVTLIVVPNHPEDFRDALARWLPDGRSAALLDVEIRIDSPAFAWITDAKTLSDRLIPHLEKHPALLHRVGTLVWWDLHQYSGVLAANFWAISHRFQRLLEHRGADSIQQLALARGPRTGETQFSRFFDLCLPGRFPVKNQTEIGDGFARTTQLHLLGGCIRSSRDASDRVSENAVALHSKDTTLEAARASVATGWRTHLRPASHMDAQAVEQYLRRPVGDRELGRSLEDDPATAGARILEVDSGDVLALPSIIAQSGRAGPDQESLHVGLVPAFGNPYVRYLLEGLCDVRNRVLHSKRRMVASEPQPGVVKRHLLLALHELPATLSDLNRTFRWEGTGEIRRTLAQLEQGNLIQRRDVRYLVPDQQSHRLRVEVEYHSNLPRSRVPPLDTIGTRLVDLFDPGDATITRIDPERITIVAYPWRVFVNDGKRYRIRQWESVDEIVREDGAMRIDCRPEDHVVKTWRIFDPQLINTRLLAGKKDVQIVQRSLKRSLVTTDYQEHISGCLEYLQDPATGHWRRREHLRLPAKIRSLVLSTGGLLLEVPPELVKDLALGLHSLVQALRHVFPVHVGVEEDAVGILAFNGRPIEGRETWGLMIVDLYPGGIGLIQSMDEDPAFLVHLLELTRHWLAACDCDPDEGCERCLKSPIAESAVADRVTMRLSRGQAIETLDRILGVSI